MVVGFRLPHLPYVFPKELLEEYPLEEVPLPEHPDKPDGLPQLALNNWISIPQRYDDTDTVNITDQDPFYKVPAHWTKVWRQHYLAAVTQVDKQFGLLLEGLAESKFAKNTIVAFTSDHGFMLGENQEWGKMSNLESALRVPLIIKNLRASKGMEVIDSPVELVDLFPTLVEMAGLKQIPSCSRRDEILCTEGKSLINISMHEESLAFSQSPRKGKKSMGYSVKSRDFRYTEWVGYDYLNFKPNFQEIHARELYDHRRDPDEYHNFIGLAEYDEHVIRLAASLRKRFQQ